MDQSHLTRVEVGLDSIHSSDVFPSTVEDQKELKNGSENGAEGEGVEDASKEEEDMAMLTEIVGAHNKVIEMAESRDQPLANVSIKALVLCTMHLS